MADNIQERLHELRRQSSSLSQKGEYRQAIGIAVQATEVTRHTLGVAHPDYATSLHDLASLYQETGDFPRAESLYQQALETYRAALGEVHPNFASTLESLGTLYCRIGRRSKAEPLYTRALEISRITLGEKHPDYLRRLECLAALYQTMREFSKAERLYRKALRIRRATLGEAHPAYAESLTNVAALYKEMGDSSKAQALFQRAQEIRLAALGEPRIGRDSSDKNVSGAAPREKVLNPALRSGALVDVPRTGFSPLPSGIASRPRLPGTTTDAVDCSVFGRPEAHPGDQTLLQVFLHRPQQLRRAKELAKEFDEQSRRLGWQSLEVDVPRETRLQVQLSVPGLVVHESVQAIHWRGHPIAVQFGIEVPSTHRTGSIIGKITVYREALPIGHIKFKLAIKAVASDAILPDAQPLGLQAHRYKKAFISYASKDRAEVLKRVQMLERFHVPYFQDLLSLEPGTRWEKELYRHIDECDLFLLFWSSSARESQWVAKEIEYALNRKGADELGPPEIVPVIIEGPPAPPPPERLRHLHFDDRLVHLAG